jgi:hypothetical protein
MKIVAIILVCTLLGVMGWLLFESNSKARGYEKKLEMLTRDRTGEGAPAPSVAEQDLIAGREQELLNQMAQSQGTAGALPPPSGRPALPATNPYASPAGSRAGSMPSATTLPPGMNPADLAPPPAPTPRQRMIAAAPVLAKVTEYQKEFGFVVINAGAKRKLEKDMTFAIRRGSAIIGRIKVTEVTDEGSVADLPVDTVPAGVTIEVGDDVIQDMPPEA